ncbi:tetratricopeptide repeat protein [Lutimonas halocynthiae]|uniref:tetratricopeptide repeat protein n=1 Tax=Lutimonas halocynthiae TaxID=1446477 RepID=UPI0025B2B76E|nr:tetratricopeptide repeat protein [Lutimonas halocynthiae]MDN3641615.1 tetratricopeptide repeat protein [Lutimonas halocynthiae]
MKNIIYVLLFLPLTIFAQEKEQEKQEPVKIKLAEKQMLRKGNDLYKQKRFVDAEVKYKKALKENQNYGTAGYNLANAVYEQDRFEEALPQYELVAKSSVAVETREKSFHNIGNVMMKNKQYDKAVEAYKKSMILNPSDEETRYNLALAQKLLKDQQNDQNKDKDKDKDKDQDKDKNQDQDQNSENKDQEEDQGEDEKKDQNENEGDNENDQNDQQDQKNEGDKKEQKKQPQPNQLSQQQIQQLLEAMNNEENKTQQKVNAKKAKGKKVDQEKDW